MEQKVVVPKSLQEKLGDKGIAALLQYIDTYVDEKRRNRNKKVPIPDALMKIFEEDGMEGLNTLLDAIMEEKGII